MGSTDAMVQIVQASRERLELQQCAELGANKQ